MTQYLFRFKFDGVELDEVNSDFPSQNAALEEAVKTFGEIIRERPGIIRPGEECWIEVGETRMAPQFRVRLLIDQSPASA